MSNLISRNLTKLIVTCSIGRIVLLITREKTCFYDFFTSWKHVAATFSTIWLNCVAVILQLQPGESLLVKPITKCESGSQTDIHPLETNIDKSYEWNEWELRRKAIKLVRQNTIRMNQGMGMWRYQVGHLWRIWVNATYWLYLYSEQCRITVKL